MALETLPLNLAHIETLTEVLASTGLHFGLNLTLGLLILSVGWWLSRRLYYIVRRACEEPVRQIVLNSGTEGAIVVEKIRSHKDPNHGFNASTNEYEDLVKAGVIDPTKVTRTALQNAASIASLMLTTEAMICAIVEEPE